MCAAADNFHCHLGTTERVAESYSILCVCELVRMSAVKAHVTPVHKPRRLHLGLKLPGPLSRLKRRKVSHVPGMFYDSDVCIITKY